MKVFKEENYKVYWKKSTEKDLLSLNKQKRSLSRNLIKIQRKTDISRPELPI
jgi:mRNA-degrading endonuclease RelE of RelBE toxin-antitoxin system